MCSSMNFFRSKYLLVVFFANLVLVRSQSEIRILLLYLCRLVRQHEIVAKVEEFPQQIWNVRNAMKKRKLH
jgi:hypothetical protein